jgi:hypothetical protein
MKNNSNTYLLQFKFHNGNLTYIATTQIEGIFSEYIRIGMNSYASLTFGLNSILKIVIICNQFVMED